MVLQHLVDLARGDLLAAAVDDLLDAAGDPDVAVGVHGPLVAGAEPADAATVGIGGEAVGVGLLVVLVAGGDVGAADDDLALPPGRTETAVGAEATHLRPGGDADRTGQAGGRRPRVRGRLVRRLGYSIGRHDLAAQDI